LDPFQGSDITVVIEALLKGYAAIVFVNSQATHVVAIIFIVNCRPTAICQNSNNSANIYMFLDKKINLKLKPYLSVVLF
jgi:hypothetical protein